MQMLEKNQNIRIVIDSAGDMPEGWAETYDIQVIPINIHFGEKTFLQGQDITNKDFYRMAIDSKVFPKTSQPSPQQFIQFYKKVAQPGDTIISLHVTGKLSGTLTSAQAAAKELDGVFRILPIDSMSGSASMGYMAREARLMDQEGMDADHIVSSLEEIAKKVQIILTLNTLEFARRSGRVKALQAALASLLNVKPLIFLEQGILTLSERVRTRSKALDMVVERMAARLGGKRANAAVVHAEDEEAAQTLLTSANLHLNCNELITTELSIGVAANLGPGTVGIIAYPVEEPNE
jgi:DegV family protein with EDD domain